MKGRKGVRIKDRWVHDRYLRRVGARGKDWARGEHTTGITSESVFTACPGAGAQEERVRQRRRQRNEPTTDDVVSCGGRGSRASRRKERQERLSVGRDSGPTNRRVSLGRPAAATGIDKISIRRELEREISRIYTRARDRETESATAIIRGSKAVSDL